MESLNRAVPKKDLAAGISTAVLVHVLILGGALYGALLMPHKPLQVPYCSVDLVSAKDIGPGSAEPKGKKGAAGKAVEKRAEHHERAARRAGPVVPIKRLAVNDAKTDFEPPRIKELEPKDVPAVHETTQGAASIDKNLDKLVARPKNKPHFSVPEGPRSVHETSQTERSTGGGSNAAASNEKEAESAGGTATGKGRGGRHGSAPGGSAFGSPNGSAAVSQILGLYGHVVQEKIQRQWSLANDRGVNGLVAVVEVQIKRSGEILRVIVMRRSGNELFDEAAVRAVNRAGPLPPVPEAVSTGDTPQFILTFRPGKVS
ncbi:MAG: energy transducer TonB [Syntrophobacteraceae bacterium]